MPDFNDLNETITNFLDSYRILAPEAKAAFEAQLDKTIYCSDINTQILYQALRQAAKDGLTAAEALEKMKKSQGKTINE